MPSNVVDHPIVKKELSALMKGTLDGSPETVSASGAIATDKTLTLVNTASGSTVALTLANGAEGQEKIVVCEAKGAGSITITPANARGGTAVTLTTAGQSAVLKFLNGKWSSVGGVALA